MKDTTWTLPDGELGTLESLSVSELGYVLAKFKIISDKGGVRYINYIVGGIGELLAKNKIFNIKQKCDEELT